MEKTPQQWAYSALVGMSLLIAGWLWQIVGASRDDIAKLQDTKADKGQASDRWTGSQQIEYMKYVEARLRELENRQRDCLTRIEKEHGR